MTVKSLICPGNRLTTVNLYHPSFKPLKGKLDLKSHPRWLSSR
ncbi:hypothetical protein Lser_V15G09263 [Lactuca serriola]